MYCADLATEKYVIYCISNSKVSFSRERLFQKLLLKCIKIHSIVHSKIKTLKAFYFPFLIEIYRVSIYCLLSAFYTHYILEQVYFLMKTPLHIKKKYCGSVSVLSMQVVCCAYDKCFKVLKSFSSYYFL